MSLIVMVNISFAQKMPFIMRAFAITSGEFIHDKRVLK